MKLEDIKCTKCADNKGENVDADVKPEGNANEPVSADSLVIVKCIDCDSLLCSNCLLVHQIEQSSEPHKLVALYGTSNAANAAAVVAAHNTTTITAGTSSATKAAEYTNEINNNNINNGELMMSMTGKYSNAIDILSKFYYNTLINCNESGDSHSESKKTTKLAESAALSDEATSENEPRSSEASYVKPAANWYNPKPDVDLTKQTTTTTSSAHLQQTLNLNGQTTARLMQIENDINKTFNIYTQMLKERKDYLLKELNTIVKFAPANHAQNVNKQVQMQYQLEVKKLDLEKEIQSDCEVYTQYTQQLDQLKEQLASKKCENNCDEPESNNGDESSSNLDRANVDLLTNLVLKIEQDIKSKLTLTKELNNLIGVNNQLIAQCKSNNPLMSIEFVSNYSAIETSIRNTFGLIRINQQQQQQPQHVLPSKQTMHNFQPAQKAMPELNVLTDMKQFNGNNYTNDDNVNLISSGESSTSSASSSSATSPPYGGKKYPQSDNLDVKYNPLAQCFVPSDSQAKLNQAKHGQENGATDYALDLEANELQLAASGLNHLNVDVKSANMSNSCSSLSSLSSSASSSAAAIKPNAGMTKHPLSYLYANFINSNPKLNYFNASDDLALNQSWVIKHFNHQSKALLLSKLNHLLNHEIVIFFDQN